MSAATQLKRFVGKQCWKATSRRFKFLAIIVGQAVTNFERYKIYCDGILINDKKFSTMYLIVENAKIITFTIDTCP